MPFIEITDPYDELSDGQRRVLDRGLQTLGDGEHVPRTGLSMRTLTAGYRVLDRMREAGRRNLPQPPSADDWRIWHLRQHQKRDVVAYATRRRTDGFVKANPDPLPNMTWEKPNALSEQILALRDELRAILRARQTVH